jgi:hypothetical protein
VRGVGVRSAARCVEIGEAMIRGARQQRGQHGRPTTARLRCARAARHGLSRGGAGISDAWALAGSMRERERRGAGAYGPARKKGVG